MTKIDAVAEIYREKKDGTQRIKKMNKRGGMKGLEKKLNKSQVFICLKFALVLDHT